VRPDRDRSQDAALAVTHDQTFANPALKARTPFVKPPVYIDYGVRVHVGGSTFINRNCYIMDTPCADIVIGEGCNIGPNCSIVGVTREFFLSFFCSLLAPPLYRGVLDGGQVEG
jgi:acetyltransferase-like isoleucine patch superfamily enzyme